MSTIAQLWKDFSESDSHLATCNIEEKERHKKTFYTAIMQFFYMQNKTMDEITDKDKLEKLQHVWRTELVLHWTTLVPQATLEAAIAEVSKENDSNV